MAFTVRAIEMACTKLGLIRNSTRHIAYSASLAGSKKVNLYDLNFDRRIKVDYKDSIKYMESEAYEKTYLGEPIIKSYRRNHKYQFPSKTSRPNCINQDGFLSTSYPCPICRDEYLVLHHENVKLIKQFLDPITFEITPTQINGLCQKQFRNLQVAIYRAIDYGFITQLLPDRRYDYDEYKIHNHQH